MLSFPDKGTIEDQRKRAIQIAKKHGLPGGLMVYHPFRQDPVDFLFVPDGYVHFHMPSYAPGHIIPGGIAGGVEIVILALEKCSDLEDRDLNSLVNDLVVQEVQESMSYVFKNVKHPDDGDFRGFQSLQEVQKTVFYLLTHCGILEGRHALTWWGEMSYNKLPTDELDANYEGRELYCQSPGIKCPFCGSRRTEACERDYTISGTRPEVHRLMGVHPMPEAKVRQGVIPNVGQMALS